MEALYSNCFEQTVRESDNDFPEERNGRQPTVSGFQFEAEPGNKWAPTAVVQVRGEELYFAALFQKVGEGTLQRALWPAGIGEHWLLEAAEPLLGYGEACGEGSPIPQTGRSARHLQENQCDDSVPQEQE